METQKEILKLWEILIPCSSPEYPICLSHHKNWDDKVRKLVSGLTLYKTVSGRWVNEGKNIEERMIQIRIAATYERMQEIAMMTKEHYEQKSVIFYLVAPEVYFV